MTVHKSEQPIVDILSQVLPLDVIKYEILPRYRLPTPEEVSRGKRMFNRCLVELTVARLEVLKWLSHDEHYVYEMFREIRFLRRCGQFSLDQIDRRISQCEEITQQPMRPSVFGGFLTTFKRKQKLVSEIEMERLVKEVIDARRNGSNTDLVITRIDSDLDSDSDLD